MIFEVDLHSPKPVYQQMMDQVKLAVARGTLQPGDRLPTIRDVAVQARVNRNTVARVYAELEREGLVYTRTGQGCFVSDRGSNIGRAEQRRVITAGLDGVLAQARLFGVPRDRLEEWIADRLDAIYPPDESGTQGGRIQ